MYSVSIAMLFSGCGFNIAKADHVDKLTTITHENSENILNLVMDIDKNKILPNTLPLVIKASSTENKARELAQSSSAINIPIESGLNLLSSLTGNPVALGGLISSLLASLGLGGAMRHITAKKKEKAILNDSKRLRDLPPDEAKQVWDESNYLN